MNFESIILFIRLARPLFLLGGMLMYTLGAGIARYLGMDIDWEIFFVGLAWGFMLQLSVHFLNEYFDSPIDQHNPNRTPFTGGSGMLGPGKLPRSTALWAAVATLTVVASLTVLLLRLIPSAPPVILFMALIFFLAFFYAVPPVQLESTGYGELTTSILVANLVPAFGLLLQTGELHRLLPMATFPLTFLHLAMLLAFELPDYSTDLKYGKRTLMVRIGWQPAMKMHNILIILGFILLGGAILLGLAPGVALPAFLVFPLGLLQIWNMNRIGAGGKPNWTTLTLAGLLLYAATAYLLAFSFWTR